MGDYVGRQFGNYRLLRLLGRGGFADVYLAQHLHLDTYAAIKVLREVRLTSADTEQFRAEARTIASLVHPHIVRVLDFGVENGVPFLVMDYALNGTLRQQYPKGSRLPLATIVSYTKQVAEALHYAHDQKLIHRDVKPENMLLGRNNEVLLSDFGFALLDRSSSSQGMREMAGSVPYMAPEQLQGRPRPASDEYALGIVVYEWLSGERPFQGTFFELASQHVLSSPPPLHERFPEISPLVEEVVRIALEKEPSKRFANVQAFAKALEQACPPRQAAVLPLSIQQPQVPHMPTLVDVGMPPMEAIGLSHQSIQPLAQEKIKSEPAQRKFPRRMVVLGLAGLAVAGASGGLGWLALAQRPAGSLSLRGPTATPTLTPILQGATLYVFRGHYTSGIIFTVAWSPDGKRIVSGASDRTAQVWNALDGGNVLKYTGHGKTVTAAAWSHDGKLIASTSDDGTVQIWDAVSGETLRVLTGHIGDVHSVAWSPDGKYLASGSNDQTVHVWDAVNGQGKPLFVYREHKGYVWDVAWSPDGKLIASGSSDLTVQVWEALTGNLRQVYRGHTDELRGVAWSPHGSHVVSSGLDKTAQVWDAITGHKIFVYNEHTDVVDQVKWSPNGMFIASSGADTTVRVWDAASGKTSMVYRDHADRVRSIDWAPDGRDIASGSWDRTVQVWRAF